VTHKIQRAQVKTRSVT